MGRPAVSPQNTDRTCRSNVRPDVHGVANSEGTHGEYAASATKGLQPDFPAPKFGVADVRASAEPTGTS